MLPALLSNADKTSKPFRLWINDVDILGNPASGGVPLGSISWEYAGSNSPAAMTFDLWDPPRAFSLPGGSRVRFWSLADGDTFQGNLLGRTSDPAFAQGRIVKMRAADSSISALDRNVVEPCSFPAGLSDVAIIQGLCGQWARGNHFTWLDADATGTLMSITVIGAMPAMTFEAMSLREAIDLVAIAANSDESLQRYAYIDEKRRLRYGVQFDGGAAPYVIVEGNPAGGQANCFELELVDDDSQIVTAVFVAGKNAAGSGWVVSGSQSARYGWRADILDAPDSDTRNKRNVLGSSYLKGRGTPVRRGSFKVTNTSGWAPNQVVTITSTSLGLSGSTFLIRHVTVTPLTGTPTYEHKIEFGARRPRMIQHLSFNQAPPLRR